MSKITRVFQNLFGSSGNSGDFGKFGSKAAGAPTYTKDPATIQALSQFLDGWASAVVSGSVPELEDMNSLFLLVFYQLCYLLQQGIPEYDASTTYYTNSFCTSGGILYMSLADSNTGNTPASSPAYWSTQFVDLSNAQTVAGVKTFSVFPITPSSAPTTNYQVANKKYVDDSKAALGSWVTLSINTVYQAATDGFVVAGFSAIAPYSVMVLAGKTDSSGSPSVVRGTAEASCYPDSEVQKYTSFCMPVKKGDYWTASLVTIYGPDSTTKFVYWIPLGT